eukprot:gnl/Dysnectes_brevis/843_a930_2424.p1 GENE.gnl/Dysnectes_brevis/843_a930_2424~~gnl/Dysnectes_brevis/843_a930_2424.p1  ORF type:complete len:333 (+),score=104.35 gnl/Dysnectes_brevis/843_a930_2424:795-1793(+)
MSQKPQYYIPTTGGAPPPTYQQGRPAYQQSGQTQPSYPQYASRPAPQPGYPHQYPPQPQYQYPSNPTTNPIYQPQPHQYAPPARGAPAPQYGQPTPYAQPGAYQPAYRPAPAQPKPASLTPQQILHQAQRHVADLGDEASLCSVICALDFLEGMYADQVVNKQDYMEKANRMIENAQTFMNVTGNVNPAKLREFCLRYGIKAPKALARIQKGPIKRAAEPTGATSVVAVAARVASHFVTLIDSLLTEFSVCDLISIVGNLRSDLQQLQVSQFISPSWNKLANVESLYAMLDSHMQRDPNGHLPEAERTRSQALMSVAHQEFMAMLARGGQQQ